MANCNCNKCNPTRGCGCADSPDRTPCSYSDCSVGSERCSDVQCAECVSYCGTSFQVGNSTEVIKFALMISQGVGACTADDVHHAPYNVYATAITNAGVTILWNAESTDTLSIGVWADPGTGYVLVDTVAPTVLQSIVTGLTPATDYKIKLISTDALAASCDSVELIVATLL